MLGLLCLAWDQKKLLCTWHIDRALRKALSGISDKENSSTCVSQSSFVDGGE